MVMPGVTRETVGSPFTVVNAAAHPALRHYARMRRNEMEAVSVMKIARRAAPSPTTVI